MIVAAFYALNRWRSEAAPSSGSGSPWNLWLWVLSAALAYSILLRPDQGLLAVAILPARLRSFQSAVHRRLLPMLAAALCTLLPLVPWTIRNARTFHVFQPLAPRSAVDPGEPVPAGFDRWYRTWGVDYSSTEDVYWNYDGAPIQLADLPSRAPSTHSAQFNETAAVLHDYNLTAKPSPALEARFNAHRRRTHPRTSIPLLIALPVARAREHAVPPPHRDAPHPAQLVALARAPRPDRLRARLRSPQSRLLRPWSARPLPLVPPPGRPHGTNRLGHDRLHHPSLRTPAHPRQLRAALYPRVLPHPDHRHCRPLVTERANNDQLTDGRKSSSYPS